MDMESSICKLRGFHGRVIHMDLARPPRKLAVYTSISMIKRNYCRLLPAFLDAWTLTQ